MIYNLRFWIKYSSFSSDLDSFVILILYFSHEPLLINTYTTTAGQIGSLALVARPCPLALEGTVQQLLILHRKGHGDAQLPALLHGALDGLISLGVSRPAAPGHLQQPGKASHGCARGFTLPHAVSPRWKRPSSASDWRVSLLRPTRPAANRSLR